MELTAENVDRVFTECLFKEDEDHSTYVEAEGIVNKMGFHPERVKTHAEEISSMLDQLPDQFHEKTGGGWSFLNACNRKDGVQWGEHRNMEQLITLGIAIKKVRYCMPREMWVAFPGGMPYFVILANWEPKGWFDNIKEVSKAN